MQTGRAGCDFACSFSKQLILGCKTLIVGTKLIFYLGDRRGVTLIVDWLTGIVFTPEVSESPGKADTIRGMAKVNITPKEKVPIGCTVVKADFMTASMIKYFRAQ